MATRIERKHHFPPRVLGGGGGGGGDITPDLKVEYVDTNGNLQTVTVATDGSTTISGIAPFLVHFDASGTRSTHSSGNSESGAWWHLGYRINYDENIGGTWPWYGASRDEDTGEPIFDRVFTTTGTKNVRLRIRDGAGNETTVSLSVVVSAPPAPTIIDPSAGSWPAFSSNSHYALVAGGNYTSFGELGCAGLHNVLFSKTGSGADPIIGTFAPETRDLSTSVLTPSANIRIQDIDCALFRTSIIGYRYCGAVRGRVRTFENGSFEWYYDNVATTANERENIRWPRGTFFWDIGEINPLSGAQYIMIAGFRVLCAHGVDFHKNQVVANHALRNFGLSHNYRHCRIRASVASASLVKHQAGRGTDLWNDFDQVGTITGPKYRYEYPSSKFVMAQMVYHAPGSTIPDICVSAGAENADPDGPIGTIELAAFSDSVSAQDAWQLVAGLDTQMNGRILSTRNIRLNNGTGAYVTQSANSYITNVPPSFQGPYLYETVNTRPVPTPF
jgi:hypothetical protein